MASVMAVAITLPAAFSNDTVTPLAPISDGSREPLRFGSRNTVPETLAAVVEDGPKPILGAVVVLPVVAVTGTVVGVVALVPPGGVGTTTL